MIYLVAVRALCEFTAKRGDLDLRFTPAPSAQEGIAGHAVVAGRRGPNYQPELSLKGEYLNLTVKGRADGYDPDLKQLEEVKTYRGDFDALPNNHRALHWAQVKIYGWLLCQQLGLTELKLALVYFNIEDQKETVLQEVHSADALRGFFEAQCQSFLAWAGQELAHRAARNQSLAALRFPHPSFRPGQRALAEAVYKSASSGRCLLAQAPTGIGKTVGTIFPLLKAFETQKLDKLFFMAAKTSGRALALDALALLQAHVPAPDGQPAKPVRVLEIVARDKACEYPDNACHGDACPLAKGFYDRLPAARSAALAQGVMDKAALREVALTHQVCPYYLSQELAKWADVVVGDYNYYFDLSALLYALTVANEWRVCVLVDEAHNMVERARQMYSAELHQGGLALLRRASPPELKKDLDKLNRAWNLLHRDQEDDYLVHPALPPKFMGALQQASAAISSYMAENPTDADPVLQRFYFDVLQFSKMALTYGQHSLFDVTLQSGVASDSFRIKGQAGSVGATQSVLCIRNVVPAPFLGPRFEAARSVVLFSATLNPWDFYTDMLGLPETSVCVEVESPFTAEQLQVKVVRNISTRYQHREASLSPMVELMARQYQTQPGNYLAFFSSFDYLQKVSTLFSQRYPEIDIWEQTRRMDEGARDQFVERFRGHDKGIGFAVLGGSFGEGIDLPGTQLIGAFIATLGLPQINPVNEQIKERMTAIFGSGYDYTYLYPGIRKVVQAAGRVIRTQQDKGVIYLMDDRFAGSQVLGLLPGWWKVEFVRQPQGSHTQAAASSSSSAPVPSMPSSSADKRSTSSAGPDAPSAWGS